MKKYTIYFIYSLILSLFVFGNILSKYDVVLGGSVCPSNTFNYHPPFNTKFYSQCLSFPHVIYLDIIQRGTIFLVLLLLVYILINLLLKSFKDNTFIKKSTEIFIIFIILLFLITTYFFIKSIKEPDQEPSDIHIFQQLL